MSPSAADALRRSLLVKPVVRSADSARRLTASLRRLGADDRTVAAATVVAASADVAPRSARRRTA
ncbi:MAG TPA: hypothetical protein VF661_08600 [Actinomycetales bacterium]